MTDKNKNLLLRLASSVVLLPTVVLMVRAGGWWSAGLMGVAAAVCAGEYYMMVFKRLSPAAWVGIGATLLLPLFPMWATQNGRRVLEHAGDNFWWIAAFFFFCWAYHLIRGPIAEAPQIAAHLVTGLLYGSLGMTALAELRILPDGVPWILIALIVTWANDTLAYFAGRFLGRHKLYPAVSPNKTWEGFFGGMVGSVGGLLVYRAFFFPTLTVVDCFAVGIAGGILGPIGDLCESMLKRAYGVKDSGKLIPGHGGLLDRIDALLFNSPMVFLYVHFLRGWL